MKTKDLTICVNLRHLRGEKDDPVFLPVRGSQKLSEL
jgi:hypothetical protein